MLSDLPSNAKLKMISLKLLQCLSAQVWLHLPPLSLRSQLDYGLLQSLIISLTHMSSNVVWREEVESLNEDLLLVKISERTPLPPSLTTFVFLHLCFQTWRGEVVRGKKSSTLWCRTMRGASLPPVLLFLLWDIQERLKPPALLVSMSDLALSLCLTLFFFFFALSLSLHRTYRQLWSQRLSYFFHNSYNFYLSFYIENTPLNSVSLSGIKIFILAVSPFKRDAYLPWILNSFPFPSLKFLFVSPPQAGFRRNQRGVRPHTHRGWPFFRFSLQIVRLFVEFHNVLLMNLLHVRLGLVVWRLEGRPEISK